MTKNIEDNKAQPAASSKSNDAVTAQEYANYKEKIKSYFIMALIVIVCVNILLGFVIWAYAESTARRENINTFNALIDYFSEDLRESIKNEILKENQREFNIPDDYISLAQRVYANNKDSVVEIYAYNSTDTDPTNKITTGVILNKQGYIITNAHSATLERSQTLGGGVNNYEPYKNIKCRIAGRDWFNLEVVDFDVVRDLAILKITDELPILEPVVFGDSDLVSVGEEAIVLGNPWGEGISTIGGVIANILPYEAEFDPIEIDMLQLNIILLQGNSGAPVFNFYEEMVGIVSFEKSEEKSKPGIGFAVSAKEIMRYIDKVKQEQNKDIGYTVSEQ